VGVGVVVWLGPACTGLFRVFSVQAVVGVGVPARILRTV
jgi:hypothetical protein